MQCAEVTETMNEFIPRTMPPAEDDPHWISRSCGGLNECLIINPFSGSVLPNCTGYAWGRMYELINGRPLLPTTNAREWFGSFEGYARGQKPALGAVACWAGTRHGHVAIVESIGPDYIMCSQSNYGGNRWELVKCIRSGSGYISGMGNPAFQGFIYCPVKFTAQAIGGEIQSPYKSVNDIALAIIRGTGPWYKVTGQKRFDKIASYGFDPEEVQARVNEILLTDYHNIDEISKAIIRGTGIWYQCYGEERKRMCAYFGFNYDQVQKRINEIMER
jgi:hypothetical protein